MDKQKTDIKIGTVTFWTKENSIQFNDNNTTLLAQFYTEEGSILIMKDSDNKVKFFHVYLGKGRTDIEYDVSKLDPNKRHMFAFTWSVQEKELAMYIDGQKVTSAKIKY